MDNKEAKKAAGEKAVDFIKEGMVVGLGTGTTATFMIDELGKRVQQGLKIRAVSTSNVSTRQAKSLNISMLSIDEVESIDITIDGADEVSPEFNGIKGGGGALLFEKIVAKASKKNIWVVDESKMVKMLGKFPVPIEVVPFGFRHALAKLEQTGLNPILRKKDHAIYKTDSGNYIIDLHIGCIHDPVKLDKELNMIPGVVENGLFNDIVDTVIIGRNNDFQIINKPTKPD
jgi:ribose 5-phosphate isomerase A